MGVGITDWHCLNCGKVVYANQFPSNGCPGCKGRMTSNLSELPERFRKKKEVEFAFGFFDMCEGKKINSKFISRLRKWCSKYYPKGTIYKRRWRVIVTKNKCHDYRCFVQLSVMFDQYCSAVWLAKDLCRAGFVFNRFSNNYAAI